MIAWYVRTRNGEIGPYTESEVRFLIRSGAIAENALVKTGEGSGWILLQDPPVMCQPLTTDPIRDATVANSFAPPENQAPQTHTAKQPRPVTSAGQTTLPTRRSWRRDSRFRPERGVAVAAVLIIIMAIFALSSNIKVSNRIPLRQLSSDSQPSTKSVSLQSKTSHPSTAGAAADAPEPPQGESVAAAEPVHIDTDQPTELPKPTPASDSPPVPDEVRRPLMTPEQRFQTGLLSPNRSDTADAEHLHRKQSGPSLQGSDLGGRSVAGRAAAIARSGGDADSERSVAMALDWLKSRQQGDGSWSFQNVGLEAKPGTLQSSSAATALAVLCFLGAGNTTTTGQDAGTVSRAFAFLEQEASESSLRKAETLYVSALAMIAFSELSAMDPTEVRAKAIAERLLIFLQQSQDDVGGGWRYTPGEPGDLSVTGWQIMALQSARTCGLDVSSATIARCSAFVDSVSSAGGSEYSYVPTARPTPCMSAVGLLSRIYLGSPKESAFFDFGFQKLTAAGPDPDNIYFNYYASIALHHYGGSLWTDWNSRMRPLLVSQQIRNGPAKGSWALRDAWGKAGGQIYQTCLSTLCLEVYYRYLPMFASREVGTPIKPAQP